MKSFTLAFALFLGLSGTAMAQAPCDTDLVDAITQKSDGSLEVPNTFSSYSWTREGSVVVGATGNVLVPQTSGSYKVTVKKMSEPYVYTLANDATQMSESLFSVFPNPSENSFTVSANTPLTADAKVTVVNMVGEVLFTKTVSAGTILNQEVVLGEKATGMYFLNVEGENIRFTRKLMLSK